MGRVVRPATQKTGIPMHDDKHNEDREVIRTNEARGGQVSKGQPMKWVLIVSTVLAALALLIIYLFFVGS
jgi:hypothetical protein